MKTKESQKLLFKLTPKKAQAYYSAFRKIDEKENKSVSEIRLEALAFVLMI